MTYIRHLYYNLLIIKNNILLNLLLIGNTFNPKYFNNKIMIDKNIIVDIMIIVVIYFVVIS